MEPHEVSQELTPSHAGIPPIPADQKAMLLALIEKLIVANSGRAILAFALRIAKSIVESLPVVA